MSLSDTYRQVFSDLARLNWWWWFTTKEQTALPNPRYWWCDPAVSGFQSKKDIPELRGIIAHVMQECYDEAQHRPTLNRERDCDKPYQRLHRYYTFRAKQRWVDDDRASDVANDLLLAKPGKRKDHIEGYYVHPEWLPIGEDTFNKLVRPPRQQYQVNNTTINVHQSSLNTPVRSDQWDDERELVDLLPGRFLTPEEAAENKEERAVGQDVVTMLQTAHQQRLRDNNNAWEQLYEGALDAVTPMFRAQILEHGPWERHALCLELDAITPGWYPDPASTLQVVRAQKTARLHSTDAGVQLTEAAKRQRKSRARLDLLVKMAELASGTTAGSTAGQKQVLSDFAHIIIQHPQNEAVLPILRFALGFDEQTWEQQIRQASSPAAFSRTIIIIAFEQRLYFQRVAASITDYAGTGERIPSHE